MLKTFIERPVLSTVISIIIVVLGIIGLYMMMAGAANQPTVSAGWQLNHTRTSSEKGVTDVLGYSTSVNQIGFTASWEIDLWGKLNNQAKAKYAALLNSNENKNLVQTTLIANIAKAYYTLLAYDEQLAITRQNIVSLQKSAETMICSSVPSARCFR